MSHLFFYYIYFSDFPSGFLSRIADISDIFPIWAVCTFFLAPFTYIFFKDISSTLKYSLLVDILTPTGQATAGLVAEASASYRLRVLGRPL